MSRGRAALRLANTNSPPLCPHWAHGAGANDDDETLKVKETAVNALCELYVKHR